MSLLSMFFFGVATGLGLAGAPRFATVVTIIVALGFTVLAIGMGKAGHDNRP